jgi:HK97 family phage major capsid protein
MTVEQIKARLAAIREKAGGSLSYVTDPAEQAEVRSLHASLRRLEEEPNPKVPPPGGSSRPAPGDLTLPGKVRATGGSGWAGAWTESRRKAAKALYAPGEEVVEIPLRTDPIREGIPVLGLRQVIGAEPNTVGSFAYLRQTLRENQARTVARGKRKPVSAYAIERVDDRVRTIAHLSEPIDRADLEDAPYLTTFLNAEMRLGLEIALEAEILSGDDSTTGGKDRMVGLLETSGVGEQGWDTDRFTTTRKAITQLEDLSLMPSAFVMTGGTWEAFELETVGTQDAYALNRDGSSMPVERSARRLWGTPVVVVSDGPVDTVVLLDSSSVRLHIREEAVLASSENMVIEDPDEPGEFISTFSTNQVQFRAEMRAGLEVSRPAGVVAIDLTHS